MINANELRIGNWVINRGEPIKVDGYIFWHYMFPDDARHIIEISQIEPIPITQDILVKCGFKFNNGIWGDGDDFELEFAGNAIQYWRDNTCYGIPLTSLHQLQNLYFSLTNNELNIEL